MNQIADSIATHSTAVSALGALGYTIAVAVVFGLSGVVGYKAAMALAAVGKDDKGNEVAWALLKTFPTTNGVIAMGIGLSIFYVVGCMLADVIGHPVQEGTQNTLGLFLSATLGIGAGQFLAKRSTDADYQRAKNAAPPKPGATVIAETANVAGSPVNIEEKPQ